MELILQERTFYVATQQEAQNALADLAAYQEQLSGIRQQIAARFQEAEAQTQQGVRVCPICGGRLLPVGHWQDILEDVRVQVSFHGPALSIFCRGPEAPMERAAQYGIRSPEPYECQGCGGFVTSPPRPQLEVGRWTPGDINPHSKSLAALVFAQFPVVEEVVYEVGSSDAGWLFRVGRDEWYYYARPRGRVLERLGL